MAKKKVTHWEISKRGYLVLFNKKKIVETTPLEDVINFWLEDGVGSEYEWV